MLQQSCGVSKVGADSRMNVLHLVGAAEERLSCVHLHQDASQRPHVDGQVVRHSQQNLRRPVEPALDVLVDLQNKTITTIHHHEMLLVRLCGNASRR